MDARRYSDEEILAMVDSLIVDQRILACRLGWGFDKLADDENPLVREGVVLYLNHVFSLEQWIEANPRRCALPENRNQVQNTIIVYTFDSGDGNFVSSGTVIEGRLSDEMLQEIYGCCERGRWFIPSQVGLDVGESNGRDAWCEIYAVLPTPQEATSATDALTLVDGFWNAKGRWVSKEAAEPPLSTNACLKAAKKSRKKPCQSHGAEHGIAF